MANDDGIIAGYYTLSPLVLELRGLPIDLQRVRPVSIGRRSDASREACRSGGISKAASRGILAWEGPRRR